MKVRFDVKPPASPSDLLNIHVDHTNCTKALNNYFCSFSIPGATDFVGS